jgi:hypothetical protein
MKPFIKNVLVTILSGLLISLLPLICLGDRILGLQKKFIYHRSDRPQQ